MAQGTTAENTQRMQIEEFEKSVVAGDFSGMAGSVAQLHERWSSLSENEQQQVLKLEAIFMSLMQLRTGAG